MPDAGWRSSRGGAGAAGGSLDGSGMHCLTWLEAIPRDSANLFVRLVSMYATALAPIRDGLLHRA